MKGIWGQNIHPNTKTGRLRCICLSGRTKSNRRFVGKTGCTATRSDLKHQMESFLCSARLTSSQLVKRRARRMPAAVVMKTISQLSLWVNKKHQSWALLLQSQIYMKAMCYNLISESEPNLRRGEYDYCY